MAIVVVAYRNAWPTKRLMLGLFLFRSIGQVGFLLTGNELFLAAFPNFLEPLFLVTVTILTWERVVRHLPDWQERGFAILHRHRWLIGTLIVIYKLQDEYFTHVANIDRSEFVQQLLGGSRAVDQQADRRGGSGERLHSAALAAPGDPQSPCTPMR